MAPTPVVQVAALLASVPAASATASLSAAALRDGETYVFAVTVRDFLGAEAVASLEVAKAGLPVPLVSAAGPRARVHPRAAALQLAARVQPSACAPPAPLALSWRLAGGPPVRPPPPLPYCCPYPCPYCTLTVADVR